METKKDVITTDSSRKKEKPNEKYFSFKRGIVFFLKSNLFLLCLLILIYINKNNWSFEGDSFVELFFILSEVMILILFIPACLKPRVYKE